MLLEMVTYRLKPRAIGPAEQRFGEAMPARTRLSPLGGSWRVDVGPLNQMIQVWPYAGMAERNAIEAAAAVTDGWPPAEDLIVSRTSTFLTPAPFSPPLEPRRLGSVYEMRIYTYTAASIGTVIQRWEEKIEKRNRLSPLVGAWYTHIGPARQWIHVWAYEDGVHRERMRVEATQQKIWPPETHSEDMMLEQCNMLLTPSAFSPLR